MISTLENFRILVTNPSFGDDNRALQYDYLWFMYFRITMAKLHLEYVAFNSLDIDSPSIFWAHAGRISKQVSDPHLKSVRPYGIFLICNGHYMWFSLEILLPSFYCVSLHCLWCLWRHGCRAHLPTEKSSRKCVEKYLTPFRRIQSHVYDHFFTCEKFCFFHSIAFLVRPLDRP